MMQQKAMKQGRNVYGHNIKGVWPHLGNMPTPFLWSSALHPHAYEKDSPTNLHNTYSFN